MFGGIGSAIVALKRNGIAMKKIIHVDHDKVATHVHRWNHDPNYNQELPQDSIEHIYDYHRFEDIVDNIGQFHMQHGRTLYKMIDYSILTIVGSYIVFCFHSFFIFCQFYYSQQLIL
jgi:hypothetical protein